jgi:hypothetical protein
MFLRPNAGEEMGFRDAKLDGPDKVFGMGVRCGVWTISFFSPNPQNGGYYADRGRMWCLLEMLLHMGGRPLCQCLPHLQRNHSR